MDSNLDAKKILRVIPSMNPINGGPCQGIRNFIPELHKLGIENEVVCLDSPNAEFLEQDLFTIHALGKSKSPWGYHKDLIPWLLSHYDKYDVVIVHGLWQYHSQAAIKAMLAFRKAHTISPKIYVMPHGMLDPYFQKAKERKLKALRNWMYWRFFENKVINEADGILFTCKEELLLARTTFSNYRPKQEINVGYGIQPAPTYRPAMRQAFAESVHNWNGMPYLLFLSRVHPKKGVDLLIKAYLQLEREEENIPQLVIAGPGLDRTYGKEMQKLASTSTNILFPGMLSGDAKWGGFYHSDAFVLPSHQENFGIAVVEALACAKPVLISNKVNIWREISNTTSGLVCKNTERETINMLKKWMMIANIEKEVMSKNAYECYTSSFSISRTVNQFLRAITS